ncbi:MAG: shikimate dehydrogenase [Desulfobacteraceae bacterium]|nr:shikimate dehydrogenase [Desulfobacteraceae bacterium]
MIRPEQQKLFGVIGNPVRHSLSPVMINAAFRAMGLPAVYAAFYVDELASDLALLHKIGFTGLSVTVPYKEMTCRLAEEIDHTAEEIGAVNTLLRTNLGWQGRNTDWIGALRAIAQAVDVDGSRTLVLGAGGAARAVAYGLKRAGAVITISNRCVGRGLDLSQHLRSEFIPLDSLPRAQGEFDIVVQCTSVGLEDNGASTLVPDSFFRPGMTVMDIVYRPRWTPFARAAKRAGCNIVSGLEMLLYQGAAQLEWWLGRLVPESAIVAMREALEEAVDDESTH